MSCALTHPGDATLAAPLFAARKEGWKVLDLNFLPISAEGEEREERAKQCPGESLRATSGKAYPCTNCWRHYFYPSHHVAWACYYTAYTPITANSHNTNQIPYSPRHQSPIKKKLFSISIFIYICRLIVAD